MIPVKCNYRRKYEGNILCVLCDTQSEESQEHIIVCPTILKEIVEDKIVRYMDIYGPLEKQIKAVNYFSLIMSTRTVLIKELEVLTKEKP